MKQLVSSVFCLLLALLTITLQLCMLLFSQAKQGNRQSFSLLFWGLVSDLGFGKVKYLI